ncbi:MAG: DUF3800 domain-containing protein [Mesorhizobium sp.]|nr:MAG: DUF3800 domain-containing protein [Mesorhizobium sp.]TIM66251.1 MAG: DUF3800 domain-containing protein [Mesorhizobium sp.]
MSRIFLFADEAGCFNFSKAQNVSRYYIVCTAILPDCSIGIKLQELRRDLAWQGAPLGDYFHATTDRQEVRNAVFEVLANEKFTIQATIMEKSKAIPKVRVTEDRFYKIGWHFHFQNSSDAYLKAANEIMITVASIGTKKKRIAFEDSVRDVVKQKIRSDSWRVAFWPANTDPCLQIADYCTWAIQRKWESGGKDTRSYELICDKITYEFDLWKHGDKHYY